MKAGDMNLANITQALANKSFKAGEDQGYKDGYSDGYNKATQKDLESVRKARIEGFRAGVKEIGDWINGNAIDKQCTGVMLTISTREWQAKLKELGVK